MRWHGALRGRITGVGAAHGLDPEIVTEGIRQAGSGEARGGRVSGGKGPPRFCRYGDGITGCPDGVPGHRGLGIAGQNVNVSWGRHIRLRRCGRLVRTGDTAGIVRIDHVVVCGSIGKAVVGEAVPGLGVMDGLIISALGCRPINDIGDGAGRGKPGETDPSAAAGRRGADYRRMGPLVLGNEAARFNGEGAAAIRVYRCDQIIIGYSGGCSIR